MKIKVIRLSPALLALVAIGLYFLAFETGAMIVFAVAALAEGAMWFNLWKDFGASRY